MDGTKIDVHEPVDDLIIRASTRDRLLHEPLQHVVLQANEKLALVVFWVTHRLLGPSIPVFFHLGAAFRNDWLQINRRSLDCLLGDAIQLG